MGFKHRMQDGTDLDIDLATSFLDFGDVLFGRGFFHAGKQFDHFLPTAGRVAADAIEFGDDGFAMFADEELDHKNLLNRSLRVLRARSRG